MITNWGSIKLVSEWYNPGQEGTMVQTRSEEKVEAHEQEMMTLRKEVSKLLTIEEKLTTTEW